MFVLRSVVVILTLFSETLSIEHCKGFIETGLNNKISNTCIIGQTVTRSKLECASTCQAHSTCRSFFYTETSRVCQTHVDILTSEDVTLSSPGTKYYTLCKDRVADAFDCADLFSKGLTTSGIFKIYPYGNSTSKDVYCDQETNGGGWLLFQKRMDGSEDFYRTWEEYENGFGSIAGEFWSGLKLIHHISTQKAYELLIELEDFDNRIAYAAYDSFSVADSSTDYKLFLGAYSGTAGDSLKVLDSAGKMNSDRSSFSTKDREHNPANCAQLCKSGFWHNDKTPGQCMHANPNGLYLHGHTTTLYEGMEWYEWTGRYYSLKKTEMKIRPKIFVK